MIRNEVYLGTLVQNKSSNIEVTNSKRNFHNEDEYIKHLNNHEAIVNEETFIKANEIFKKIVIRLKIEALVLGLVIKVYFLIF
ncbi:hypothetical protein CYK87_12040 [Clostridium perfringens]|nr:hypothetical protein CYK87_12040 [Clostridium perfringens]